MVKRAEQVHQHKRHRHAHHARLCQQHLGGHARTRRLHRPAQHIRPHRRPETNQLLSQSLSRSRHCHLPSHAHLHSRARTHVNENRERVQEVGEHDRL